MAKIFDRVKFNVPSTPGTGTVTVGTRYDNGFYLPAEEGASDGDKVFYLIQKTNKDFELGIGTIASSATEVERTTVLSSCIGATDGTTKINIDGTAFMAFVTPAYALKSLRVARTVTGTTDTITNGDGNGVVTYNSASAVAVSLAQAGTAGLYDGWFIRVRNINSGAVTITPTTSTINGASTLVLANGDSAMIWSDGTNYQAIQAGAVRYDKAQPLTAVQQAQARSNVSAALKGHIWGLLTGNNTTDPTNDIDIATGEAASTETNPVLMVLSSPLTKRLDAAWAAGTNQGGLDTGSVANGTYFVWLIQRSDTGATDVLFSLSASSPTMPANYDRKRLIWAIVRVSGAIKAYRQTGDRNIWDTVALDYNVSNLGTTTDGPVLTVPVGVRVVALIRANCANNGVMLSNYDESNQPVSSGQSDLAAGASGQFTLLTNSSAQIKVVATAASTILQIGTFGFVLDRRAT